MAMKTRLGLRQTQGLALSSAMRTSLSVLRMSSLELAEEIEREAGRNPFLLRTMPPVVTGAAGAEPLAALAARAPSFQESLRRQLVLMDLTAPVLGAALLLVGELREDGMLDVGIEALAEETGIAPDLLETALEAVQRCEPAGIGARDMAESFRLQLVDLGLAPDEARRTVEALRLFASGDWAGVQRRLGIDRAEAERRAALMRRLTTRPVSESAAEAPPLRPDLRLVRAADGTLGIVADRRAHPQLSIDEALARRTEADGFAPDLLARARALVAAVEQRGQTLRRIGEWLVAHQPGFFADGPAALAPATRARMAADLELHPTTVGRALAGKAIDIDGRLWPLTVFFSAALPAREGPVSARHVQSRIARMIADEPAGAPLSDEVLTERLRAEGVDIARRTVAKYRQGLRIPSSAARRKQALARQGR